VNLPNRITVGRLLLAALLFVLLELYCRGRAGGVWYGAFVLYLVAVVSDGLDGYFARLRNEITAFGRIADPFADKIVICGLLVLTQSIEETEALVPPWLVLLVLAREFLVSGLRGFLEGRGAVFGARWEGKTKMAVQAVFCGTVLFYPGSRFEWVFSLGRLLVWVTAAVTVLSAFSYVRKAREMLSRGTDV